MIVESVKINTTESTRSVKELRKELRDLKDQLVNTQKGTQEYNKTMIEAANIQHELREQMQEINASAMDWGQKVANCTRVMTGLSGAITAATGVMSLFGIENEETQKKITATMTSLIGITQGLEKLSSGAHAFQRLTRAINTSTGAMGKFRAALISTGLGALVVLLGSIIAYWNDFTEAIGLSSKQMEHFGDVAKGVLNAFMESLRGIAKAMGHLLRGEFGQAWDALKDGFSIVDNYHEGVAKSIAKREEEQTKKLAEEAAQRAKIAEDEYKKRIEAAQKLAKYERDMEAAKYRGIEDDTYTQAAYDRQMKYFDTLFKVYRKDSEEYRNLILEKEEYLQDWENHWLKEAEKKRVADEAEQARLQKQAEMEAQRAHDERQRLLDNWADSLLTEQEHLDKRYQMLIEAAEKEGMDTLAITAWYEEEKKKLVEKTEEEITEIRRDSVKDYATIAGAIGDVLGSISDTMEEGTAKQKGLATASTTIQMLAGIATALSGAFTTKTGPWDIALAAAQAATIAASGIASIVKINQVQPDGSANISMPSVNMGTVIGSAPDFTQTIDSSITSAAIKDQKVYVTEHDITETQTKVKVAQERATY